MAIGAEVCDGGVSFRVWAPNGRKVSVVLEPSGFRCPLRPETDGYFSEFVPNIESGQLYRFFVDEQGPFPDPASRFQPSGPFGPSQVVDEARFNWSDDAWTGLRPVGQVFYEMHVGTFSSEGTWRSAAERLPELKDVGITTIEIMPVGEFPGRFNWGYDGVNLFAPSRNYGEPDDFRFFVNEAHRLGIGVILDVVYNHFGPSGNFIGNFSSSYFSERYENEWGNAINFDDEHSHGTREFFLENAKYWIREFHLDGLRLDATQQIFDASPLHILDEIEVATRREARGRGVLLICENESQDTKLVRKRAEGGYEMDGLWNDDFHHSALVALTGQNEAYFNDYRGTAQEFISSAKWGYLYQGQWYSWQAKRRGTACIDLPPSVFVNFLENHDQVANSARGDRLFQRTSQGKHRAMTALLLLLPSTPLLFQGQEFASSKPFLYFADHEPELAKHVKEGRIKFLSQFPSLAGEEAEAILPDPAEEATFLRCKLSDEERSQNLAAISLHRDLLRLRKNDSIFSGCERSHLDGEVISEQCFLIRLFGVDGDDRVLLVNLGRELQVSPRPFPLLVPPAGREWKLIWSSQEFSYGGVGMPELEWDGIFKIPGETTIVLSPELRV